MGKFFYDLRMVSAGSALLIPALVGVCYSDSLTVAVCTLLYICALLLAVNVWEPARRFMRRYVRSSIRLQLRLHLL